MNFRRSLIAITSIITIPFLITSCANVEKTVYFNDQRDSSILAKTSVPKTTIQPNDILSITISSINPQATLIFNTPNTSYVAATGLNGNAVQSPGYLVNTEGYITFPVLGNIKVNGLTTNQIQSQLTKMLTDQKLLVDPIVMVRQLNFRVSVLGEVAHPTVVNVPSEKISLLEALGMAGDITIYGRKDNVLVIREENGIKRIKRLNLNSNELFNSQYYYLKSNDIVYVEANKAKVASSSRTTQTLPIILSALSFGAIIVDRLVK
ncbi:polysaccharide biosynthesis/export family protein [Mucilaginibacter sp. RS28]|uniref:Polysaccharide biosynthesis/export family protein n=1 Tax=Mucilaginibacter straminoryzae TaxID=2932774 RepID=A0A9X2BCK9_9SPHI|nr:polysaccharide biosynthesis/export family protein [Mucilaginibacter straminoryzae]MCJ8211022.1 polysaccharide biosynthesis/export family protein [Mucilaginibacter straminoryzae]